MTRALGRDVEHMEVAAVWQRWTGQPGISGELVEGYFDGYDRRLPTRQGAEADAYRQGHVTGLFDRLRDRSLGTGLDDIRQVTEAARRPAFEPRAGEPVRWKQGRGWRSGRLAADPLAGDGSVRVVDGYSGGARSLRSGLVEVRATGPRGGRHWSRWDDVVLAQARPCELAGCAEQAPGQRAAAQFALRNHHDELIPACWKHASIYYAWELEPVTDPSVGFALATRPTNSQAVPPRPRPTQQAASPVQARGI